MRPILSAAGTYNYPLAKWLDEKLKPLSTSNKYCINDIFGFIDEIKNTSIEPNHILVPYDVSALFTNVPLKETFDILVDKAFEGDWFNKTHSMQLQKHQLMDLLEIATTNQLFQFNGELYEETGGVAMGSPLGPLLANVFMCHIEDHLEQKSMIPSFYRRYVDDTSVTMPNTESATDFLQVLNKMHPSLSFTMELEHDGSIPFLGTVLTRCGGTLQEKSTKNQPTQDCYSISKATLTADTRKAWSTRWLTVLTVYLPPKKDLQKNATSYAPCFQSCVKPVFICLIYSIAL